MDEIRAEIDQALALLVSAHHRLNELDASQKREVVAGGECRHPSAQRITIETMGGAKFMCGVCGETGAE